MEACTGSSAIIKVLIYDKVAKNEVTTVMQSAEISTFPMYWSIQRSKWGL